MIGAPAILERLERLTEAQRERVLELISNLEIQAQNEAAIPASVHDYPEVTGELLADRGQFYLRRGAGPWCSNCGATMGMHGGEYICTSCHPF